MSGGEKLLLTDALTSYSGNASALFIRHDCGQCLSHSCAFKKIKQIHAKEPRAHGLVVGIKGQASPGSR